MIVRVSDGRKVESRNLVEWAAGMSTGLAQEMQRE